MTKAKTVTEAQILDAAMELLKTQGPDGLNMRKLGAALGVEGATLYYHVAGKEALIQKIVDRVAGQVAIRSGEEDRNWPELMRIFAERFRAVLIANPGAAVLAATHSVSPEVAGDLAVPLITVLERDGVGLEKAQFMIQSVAIFVTGHALAEVGNAPEPPTAPKRYYDEWFEYGITALLKGFEQTL